jgi:S-adenosyl-L-methionine hydrolase (adenosine-forming)
MKTIALLTDFGLNDHYAGTMKGVILSIQANVQVVDLCHHIKPQDIVHGALVLKSAYRFFPKKTIFVAVVDPGVGSARGKIILKTKDYVFVAPDNGILSLVAEIEKQTRFYEITNDRYFLKPASDTFHGRDIFAPVAAYLTKGLSPLTFGNKIQNIVRLKWPNPLIDRKHKRISGEVVHIDRFGNLVTNISEKDLKRFRGRFSIHIKNKSISQLSHSYAEAKKGQLLGIIGSMGFLEIAANGRSAGRRLKVLKGERVKINEA